ncbi:MAG: deoxyribose-phosphate aldolase [Treponema sp.]|jgi:deoxyribose-phosphate aldolase|nr:deoxyribose-phosphate aldolase [Treponema sp.]
MKLTKQEFVKYVDHSLLKPNLDRKEVIAGLEFARDTECVSVCINTCNLDRAYEVLKGSKTIIGTVIGFPSGAHTTLAKVMETIDAYSRGAMEMDMVIDVGALINGEYDDVRADIAAVVKASPAIVKVILENCFLTKEQIVTGCKLAEEAGAAYVKTSTGFAAGGAKVEDIVLMRKSVSPNVKVKAAGGISSLADCYAMIEAGVSRVGISRTRSILAELEAGA